MKTIRSQKPITEDHFTASNISIIFRLARKKLWFVLAMIIITAFFIYTSYPLDKSQILNGGIYFKINGIPQIVKYNTPGMAGSRLKIGDRVVTCDPVSLGTNVLARECEYLHPYLRDVTTPVHVECYIFRSRLGEDFCVLASLNINGIEVVSRATSFQKVMAYDEHFDWYIKIAVAATLWAGGLLLLNASVNYARERKLPGWFD